MEIIKLNFQINAVPNAKACWTEVSAALSRFYEAQHAPQHVAVGKVPSPVQTTQTLAAGAHDTPVEHLGERVARPLGLEEIKQELKQLQPVAAMMKHVVDWHLVVIYGVDMHNKLYIADSLHGNTRWPIAAFSDSYLGRYQWVYAYKTTLG